jgi:hypothetical protein
LVSDKNLAKAVAAIPQRSEKQSDTQKLVVAFVDPGILPQVENVNSQIIYGRRGTGKTHILRVLASSLRNQPKNCVVYMDARAFGSTSQFADLSVPLVDRCTALFRDLLSEVYNELLQFVVNLDSENADSALESLNGLGVSITEPVSERRKESASLKEKDTSETSGHADITLQKASPGITFGISGKAGKENEQSTTYKFEYSDKIIFPSVSGSIRDVLASCKAELYILIDEWSSLPLDVQPYLAEFLKRSFIPLPNVSLKIGALEHRSDFTTTTANGILGFEIGADISAALDIDDYYVYDRNPEGITDSFAEILIKHLANEMGAEELGVPGLKCASGEERHWTRRAYGTRQEVPA